MQAWLEDRRRLRNIQINLIFHSACTIFAHPNAGTLNQLYELRRLGWDDILKRRLLDALILTIENLANSVNVRQKQSNGECLMGMFSYSFVILVVTTRIAHKVSYIHIGVRLRVARFDEQGNARASKCETGNRYRFSRFSYI